MSARGMIALFALVTIGAIAGVGQRLLRRLLPPCCALLLTSCAASQAGVPDDTRLREFHRMLYEAAGLSLWDCRYEGPTVWLRIDYRASERVLAHELMHVAQMQRAGSCEAWNQLLENPLVRDSLEAEAERLARGRPH